MLELVQVDPVRVGLQGLPVQELEICEGIHWPPRVERLGDPDTGRPFQLPTALAPAQFTHDECHALLHESTFKWQVHEAVAAAPR